jgi:hypothetical protein
MSISKVFLCPTNSPPGSASSWSALRSCSGCCWSGGAAGISRKPPYVPYPALRPATVGERLPVVRDGQEGTAWGTAINLHRGGRTSTGSEGCQTIHPDQYKAFLSTVYMEMARLRQKTVTYILTENK